MDGPPEYVRVLFCVHVRLAAAGTYSYYVPAKHPIKRFVWPSSENGPPPGLYATSLGRRQLRSVGVATSTNAG